MNLKELIFGGGVKDAGGNGGAYRDSIQAWLPIKNIVGGVIVTKDNRFVKVCEVLPVNFYLKSPADQENIILSFAAYLKIAPNTLQIMVRTQKADMADYVARMRAYAEAEENEKCREMIDCARHRPAAERGSRHRPALPGCLRPGGAGTALCRQHRSGIAV